jgi:hypothetical protein
MTSQINPSNIDGQYPVAGQDNNSQGFRTNFTNTVTNFQYAKNEITDLQNKAVLKAALTGTALDNNMQGSPLSNAVLSNMAGKVVTIPQSTGTIPVDYSAGPVQTFTLGGNSVLSFTAWPVSGTSGTVTIQVTVTNTAYTLTFPSYVTAAGIQGLVYPAGASPVIEFAAVGTYTFVFSTIDSGATVTINSANESLVPFNNSKESFASGNISLATTTSFFTAGGTGTLPDGVEGQIKVLTQTATASMVITAASHGWAGAGTITLATRGQGCTLQYTNSAWYCIGNNGAVFA